MQYLLRCATAKVSAGQAVKLIYVSAGLGHHMQVVYERMPGRTQNFIKGGGGGGGGRGGVTYGIRFREKEPNVYT